MNLKQSIRIPRILILLGILVTMVIPSPVFAQDVVAAKTTPPPLEFSTFTIFNPNFNYLNRGEAYITDKGNQKVTISGESSALERVDKIGVQLTLQRWTGSAWIDIFTGSNTQETDSTYVYVSHGNLSVLSGYYYRTKSYHWIQEGSIIESGTHYSSSILIN
jgi:hypothetical protein